MSRKSFKDNPALQFVSSRTEMNENEAFALKPESGNNTISPLQETKSKRFNMLMRPSTFGQLQRKARERGVSTNELINSLIEVYIEEGRNIL